MDIYKKASQVKLRVPTSKGEATVEQLWTFKVSDLRGVIKELNSQVKAQVADDLDFLEETSTADPILQLRFDITKDIYLTKVQEAKDEAARKANKESNASILALIAEKEAEALKGKSIDELKKMLV